VDYLTFQARFLERTENYRDIRTEQSTRQLKICPFLKVARLTAITRDIG
jgi:hypothetical protein